MQSDWLRLLLFSAFLIAAQSLPTGVSDEAKKSEQSIRPKVKRSQEFLMFGNQQNRQHTTDNNNAANTFSPSAEKRTLSNSGLDDVASDVESSGAVEPPKALPSSYAMDQPSQQQPREKNFEYGKVLVNEVGNVMTRGAWEIQVPPAYRRYYGIRDEDRRKRSENNGSNSPATSSSSISASTAAPATPFSAQSVSNLASQMLTSGQLQSLIGQPRRGLPSYYQDSRYKRESDFDPEDFLALLSLYDNERRNRRNWRNYDSDEYDTIDDESNMIGLDDEDPRGNSWLDQQLGSYQPQHHYLSSEPILSQELAALSRSRPSNYYEQYLGTQQQQQYSNNGQYDSDIQYGTPQYGVPYAQQLSYYSPEKRFMITRKRSAQNYDSYGSRNGQMMNSRGYPSYQHRLLY